jgi:hypothetical protein
MRNTRPIREEENEHMTDEVFEAYADLVEAGCPVKIWWQVKPRYQDYRGFFWIDSEEEGSSKWLDYYSKYEGSEKLQSTLDKAGLYFEWENSAVATVQFG